MKKAFWFSFLVIFLLSISALAQSDVSATSTQEEEALEANAKTQKVSEIRKVVIVRDLNQLKALQPNANQIKAQQSDQEQSKAQELNAQQVEKVQYDDKGGIIVPDASKGIKISSKDQQNVAAKKIQLNKSNEKKSQQEYLDRMGDKKQVEKVQSKSGQKKNN